MEFSLPIRNSIKIFKLIIFSAKFSFNITLNFVISIREYVLSILCFHKVPECLYFPREMISMYFQTPRFVINLRRLIPNAREDRRSRSAAFKLEARQLESRSQVKIHGVDRRGNSGSYERRSTLNAIRIHGKGQGTGSSRS